MMREKLASIGIATKNRWQDLKVTLDKLTEFNLSPHIPIIIYDDASDSSCPFNWEKIPLNIQIKQFKKSQGYIARRNQLAEAISTKYYLSLDDDSFPIAGSLVEAIEFAESHESDLFCLAFPIYNPVLGEYQSQSLYSEPYQVRSFIGCGHLLHLPRFLELGGYREELTHQGEEMEIAARAFQKGYKCYHFPNLEIHHTASNQGRNWHRMDYYGARNNFLWNDWYVPESLKLIKQSRSLVSMLKLSIQVGRLGVLKGEIAGFKERHQYSNNRQPMSTTLYQEWQSLPRS